MSTYTLVKYRQQLTGKRPYGHLISLIRKGKFFQAVTMSVLLYDCTIQTLTKHLEKKVDENYTWTFIHRLTSVG